MIDIALRVPSYNGMVLDETKEMIDKIIAGIPGVSPLQTLRGSSISTNRNLLVTSSNLKKQTMNFKYLLFIDTDVYHDDPCTIVRDLLSFDLPVVSAVYPYRSDDPQGKNSYYPVGFFPDCENVKLPIITKRILKIQTKPMLCDIGSLGFCLIKKEAFEALEFPYFAEPAIDCGDSGFVIGDDVYFFWKLKQIGIQCMVDFRHVLNHKAL